MSTRPKDGNVNVITSKPNKKLELVRDHIRTLGIKTGLRTGGGGQGGSGQSAPTHPTSHQSA